MTHPPRRVAVLSGVPSREHDVSIASGRAVAAALRSRRSDVLEVHVAADGRWSLADHAAVADTPRSAAITSLLHEDDTPRVDVVFIALHGAWGEDGTLQGFLETLGLPYTGSGVAASALAMDKERSKEVLAHHGVATPAWCGIDAASWSRDRAGELARAAALPGPYVAKPAREGSSFGVALPDDVGGLAAVLDAALDGPGARVLVEHRVTGVEVTCPVLGNHDAALRTLPLVEIVPHEGTFFDFHAKYEGGSDEICPARVSDDVAARVQHAAELAHRVLGCDGMSRSDFIVDAADTPWYLETNTIPGMTPASLSPLSAAAAGLPFPELCEALVELAMARHVTGASGLGSTATGIL